MSLLKHLTDVNFSEEIKKAPLALVDFWAPWCGPCRMMEPILEETQKQLSEKVTIMKMNVDENMVVPSAFHIQGIPTMILFKSGTPVEVIVGMRPLHELQELLRKHM